MLFHQFVVELRDGSLGHNGAAVHDVESISHVDAEVEILLDQQDVDLPFLVQELDRPANLLFRSPDEISEMSL